MEHIVLCPGSRSGPFALAAGQLAKSGNLSLSTAIDERSAAFFALGIGTAIGKATAVITTSGSAVAHLLPAAIEADRSCQPLLLITADRPFRLKECGSNQTVNQEDFLRPVCRWFEQGPRQGIHLSSLEKLDFLVAEAWYQSHSFPGPVHINVPLEEPLHASTIEQQEVWSGWTPENCVSSSHDVFVKQEVNQGRLEIAFPDLDPSRPGVVVAGPWRGSTNNLSAFNQALSEWLELSGWPVFADPLSGVTNEQPGLIHNWELLISSGLMVPQEKIQVLRLGPLPATRALEDWLTLRGQGQLLITEGDDRRLDPLGLSKQWSRGLVDWLKFRNKCHLNSNEITKSNSFGFLDKLLSVDAFVQEWLDKQLPLEGLITEPTIAHWLPRLLPTGLPIMLSASSPVRDYLSFADSRYISSRCFGFRGASGIDGTLSLALGLSKALGPLVLISGDLALLHDSNGWLLSDPKYSKLVILLIDNGGGGIFKQLPLETVPSGMIGELFSMPQAVDHFALAEAHHISHRQVSCLEDLQDALEWGLSQVGPVLLRVCTNAEEDAHFRNKIRIDLAQHVQTAYSKNLFEN